ncbi:hypothetical protein [Streptomyces sp. NPDC058874]
MSLPSTAYGLKIRYPARGGRARPDGGFNDHLRNWEATPGTW